jgi:hypothetical protein
MNDQYNIQGNGANDDELMVNYNYDDDEEGKNEARW